MFNNVNILLMSGFLEKILIFVVVYDFIVDNINIDQLSTVRTIDLVEFCHFLKDPYKKIWYYIFFWILQYPYKSQLFHVMFH